MTTEFVLLLGLFAFLLLGTFLNSERGVQATFNKAAPRLAAKIEADISVGKQFRNSATQAATITWQNPED